MILPLDIIRKVFYKRGDENFPAKESACLRKSPFRFLHRPFRRGKVFTVQETEGVSLYPAELNASRKNKSNRSGLPVLAGFRPPRISPRSLINQCRHIHCSGTSDQPPIDLSGCMLIKINTNIRTKQSHPAYSLDKGGGVGWVTYGKNKTRNSRA